MKTDLKRRSYHNLQAVRYCLLSSGIKNDTSIAHAAVGVTSLRSEMTGILFAKAVAASEENRQKFKLEVLQRRTSVFGLMTLTGLAAVGVYVAGFIQKRKESMA